MMTNMFEQVGKRILLLLDEKNMTQIQLASALKISKQVLNKIIQGRKAINIFEISEIAKALNVSVDDLLKVTPLLPPEPSFSFMGNIKNQKTREKVLLLKDIIDEILFLEDYANGCNEERSTLGRGCTKG